LFVILVASIVAAADDDNHNLEKDEKEEIVVVSLDQVYEAYPELKAICEQLELSQCAVWDNVDSEWLIDDYDDEEEYDEDEFEEEQDAS
jgi:hypothetical protein